jgi:hypothetical protein
VPTAVYKRYQIRLPNKSVANVHTREALWKLFAALSDVLDPGMQVDIQLVDLTITITAAQGSLEQVQAKAESAAAKWVEELDLLA